MIDLAVSGVFYYELKSHYCVRHICLSLNPPTFALQYLLRLREQIKTGLLLGFHNNNNNNNSNHECNSTPSLLGVPSIKRDNISKRIFAYIFLPLKYVQCVTGNVE
jgi:hypothetical protein